MGGLTKSSLAVALLGSAWIHLGCAGYAGDVGEIRSALIAGAPGRALDKVDDALEVDEPDHYPVDMGGDVVLLITERGMVKHALGMHASAALDFRVADKHLEILDIKNNTLGNIAKWMFSGDAGVYKAPAHEKLLLNTYGMLNYLAIGDLESARVEARRFRIISDYIADDKGDGAGVLPMGDYLAGFVFEMSGRFEEALGHYTRAAESGSFEGGLGDVRRVARCTGFRDDRVRALLGDELQINEDGTSPACEVGSPEQGEILVVTSVGLAPYKIARRFPIGAALVMGGLFLGAGQTAQAQQMMARGVLKVVSFPELRQTRSRFKRIKVTDGGSAMPLVGNENVAELVRDEWERVRGKLMAAAIVRMLTRAVVAGATDKAVGSGSSTGFGILAGLLVEGAMVAADTPDTRSWVTLPAYVSIVRKTVKPGVHNIAVSMGGALGQGSSKKIKVDVPGGGFSVVSMASMR